MAIRSACAATVFAAAMLTSAVVLAWPNTRMPTQFPTKPRRVVETPIALVGCVEREADYRREYARSRGGSVGTGSGVSNEYVLINATRTNGVPSGSINCEARTDQVYELTGGREDHAAPYVGRPVAVTGTLKLAKAEEVKDLHLHEVKVASVRGLEVTRVPEQVQVVPEPIHIQEAPAQSQSAAIQPRPPLPRTASPLPIAAMLGVLSLGGALGMRVLRPRRRR